jgi:hypothetical protein
MMETVEVSGEKCSERRKCEEMVSVIQTGQWHGEARNVRPSVVTDDPKKRRMKNIWEIKRFAISELHNLGGGGVGWGPTRV